MVYGADNNQKEQCLFTFPCTRNQGTLKAGSITVRLTSCLTSLEMCLCAVQNSVHQVPSTFLNWSNRRSTVQWCFPFNCSLGWSDLGFLVFSKHQWL